MSDFATICIMEYQIKQEADRATRRNNAQQAFYAAFNVKGDMLEVSEDGDTVKVGELVFAADHDEHGAVDFRYYHICPSCNSWHTYHVASRADVGRVLAQTGCSDCGG